MELIKLTPEQEQSRKRRNLMLALGIGAFMVLVFAITLAKLGASVMDRPL